ncbi:MAG: hypothetical protein MPJ24_02880 [Pirellulaceae bacterium]|nr:hypothetical protein [Pirellulaceae bacterium]
MFSWTHTHNKRRSSQRPKFQQTSPVVSETYKNWEIRITERTIGQTVTRKQYGVTLRRLGDDEKEKSFQGFVTLQGARQQAHEYIHLAEVEAHRRVQNQTMLKRRLARAKLFDQRRQNEKRTTLNKP